MLVVSAIAAVSLSIYRPGYNVELQQERSSLRDGLTEQEKDLGWSPSEPQGRNKVKDGRTTFTIERAINQGMKTAWNNMEGVQCDSRCLRDIYLRATRHFQRAMSPASLVPPPARPAYPGVVGQTVSPSTFAAAYQDVSLLAPQSSPQMMSLLAAYVPQVVRAEKQLAEAIKNKQSEEGGAGAGGANGGASQFQFNLKTNDEYDVKGQRKIRKFVKPVLSSSDLENIFVKHDPDDTGYLSQRRMREALEDLGVHLTSDQLEHLIAKLYGEGLVEMENIEKDRYTLGNFRAIAEKELKWEEEHPQLVCGEGKEKLADSPRRLDRLDDCELRGQQDYNRMFFLDREKSAVQLSPSRIHSHMMGVKKLVDRWRPLLVGAGGGSGEPGAFDDPYYFCYDQYQEDPEFDACMRDLAVGKHGVYKWAQAAVAEGDPPMRAGFPKDEDEGEGEKEKREEKEESVSFLEPYEG